MSFVLTKALPAFLFVSDSIVKLPVFKHAETSESNLGLTFLIGLLIKKRALPSQVGWLIPVTLADAGGLQVVLSQRGFKVSHLKKQALTSPQRKTPKKNK